MLICGDQLAVGLERILAGAELGHGLLDHLLVELVAHFLDVARLLVAQQVAGTAQVEIVAGQREAGTQRVRATAAPSAACRRRR